MVLTRHLRRLLATSLLLALLPVASAAADDAAPATPPTASRVVDVVRGLASSGVSASQSAAAATASGSAAAAEGTASFLGLLADGAVAAAAAIADAAAATTRAVTAAAGFAVDVGGVLAVVVGEAAASVATLAAAAGAALVSAARSLGTLLASLAGEGARWVAEHPREALYGTAAVGAAGLGSGLLLWLKRLGAFAPIAGLYTRIASGRILDNSVRAKVFEEVRANPGVHPSALKERLGLGWGTVVYHLDRLEETGLVTARKGSGQKCYFVNGSGISPPEQRATAALKHPSARAIADFVRARPAAAQKDVGANLGMSPALVSWHVKRLVAAGILAQERTSRGVVLRLAQGAEPALVA